MAGLTRAARAFLEAYRRDYSACQRAAVAAKSIVEEALQNSGADIHLITARAKAVDSLRAKLRRKGYTRSAREITDTIGVRVITYYANGVDLVAQTLAARLEVDTTRSADRRAALGLQAFGYRSVHLIARLKEPITGRAAKEILGRQWFEIQIRSVLEHAWAEIEHEVVYKAGVKYPDAILRRFAALAGALEILEQEFLSLRAERGRLIEGYRGRYLAGQDERQVFDVARLLAFMEATRPGGRSWRQAAQEGQPLPPGLDASCVEALAALRLHTPRSLRAAMGTPRFHSAVRSFAASHGLVPAEVSHLALIVIAVALKDSRVLEIHFPEMVYDRSLKELATELGRPV